MALWPRAELAKDAGVDDAGAGWFGGAALAYNTRSDAEVDEVLAAAEKAGGRIVKPAGRAFWGGWYGYFADSGRPSLGGRAQPGIPDRRRRQHLAAAHEPRPL